MHNGLLCASAVAFFAAVAFTTTLPASPAFWQVATQAEFLRGEIDQLSLDEHGRVRLGPQLDRVFDPAVPVVWTSVAAPDGSVFLGTGNEGRVFRVDRNGRGTVFFDSSELEVHALAPAPDGGLFVGTSPDGRVYKVSVAGDAQPWFDPDDKYIWALTAGRDGTLYAATGPEGRVYRISPSGDGAELFATRTTHATALALSTRGELLVGTGTPGRVFRVDENGRGFLLLDTTYQEVRSMRLGPSGELYVAAQSRPASPADAAGPAVSTETAAPALIPSVSTEITSIAIIDAPVTPQSSTASAARDDRRAPTGAVYRVAADGLWDVVWQSRDDAPYDLALEADGSLLVATGGRGKVFRLTGNPLRPMLLARVAAEHATTLLPLQGRTLLVTANPGLLLALSSEHADRGTYESEVRDARTVATWGTLSWRATVPRGARLEISTRSGNTRTPDAAWSDWSAPYDSADGSLITSPKARYLQWRAVLSSRDASPILTSVSAAFLPRNARPQVGPITVHPPGVVFQRPFSSGETEIAGFDGDSPERTVAEQSSPNVPAPPAPALGRRTFRKGFQTIVWKADDEDNDRLRFDVLFRREGETEWRALRSGLTDPITVWDTTSAPNGTYTVKVVASDALSHPEDSALTGELESASFDIDNTAPMVTAGKVREVQDDLVVAVDVRDNDSPVRQVEFSLDTQRWQNAYPADGLLDARTESIEIRIPRKAAAGQTLVIRVTDAMHNVGGGYVQLPR